MNTQVDWRFALPIALGVGNTQFQENFKKVCNWWQPSAFYPKAKSEIVPENSKKSAVKHFKETSILVNFPNLSAIFLSMIAVVQANITQNQGTLHSR